MDKSKPNFYLGSLRNIAICITNPEHPARSSFSNPSGILQILNFRRNADIQASKTVWERSCWAIMHSVGWWGCFPFERWQISAQVWTNGSISASLNIQSQATIAVIFSCTFERSGKIKSSRDKGKLNSQSKPTTLILPAVLKEPRVFFGPAFAVLLDFWMFVVFSRRLSLSFLKT